MMNRDITYELNALIAKEIFDYPISSRPVIWWNPDGCWGIYEPWEPNPDEEHQSIHYFYPDPHRDVETATKEWLDDHNKYKKECLEKGATQEEMDDFQKNEQDFVREFGIHQYYAERVDDYSTSYDCAFQIISHIKENWIFSRREKFFKALTYRFPSLPFNLIAWPDALMLLEPKDICLAALDSPKIIL